MKRFRMTGLLMIVVLAVIAFGVAEMSPTVPLTRASQASAATTVALAASSDVQYQATTETIRVGQPASQPGAITIADGADVETEINEAVYLKANPSVVYIENIATLARAPTGASASVTESSGSGFVWDLEGHIVTNNHVVSGAERINVTFSDGITVPAQIVGTDAGSDLAVVRVDPELVDLVPVEQGDIADVQVGGRAIAIGNPFGLVGTMTTGIVSALGRSLAADPDSASSFTIPQVIQTDAAINPGNSGGPLLNELGEVIGVNFQIRSSGSTAGNTGIGFAIPINIVQRVVPALIEDGGYQHAYLGIRGQTYSPAWADALDLPQDVRGAYVMDVVQGGPAGRGGLRGATQDTDVILGIDATGVAYLPSGGDLITAVDDEAIATFDDLLVYLENHRSPGDTVTLTVLRAGGHQSEVTVTLGVRPTNAR